MTELSPDFWVNIILVGTVVVSIFITILYNNRTHNQTKEQLNMTKDQLKATQTQLDQSKKNFFIDSDQI